MWTGYQNYSFPALDSGVNQTNAAYVNSMQGDNNTTIIAIRDSVFLPDGNLEILTIETTADRASQMYLDAIESIAVNGQHLEPSYTVAEIELIIATSASDSDQPTLAHHEVRSTMATFGIRQTFSEICRLVYLPPDRCYGSPQRATRNNEMCHLIRSALMVIGNRFVLPNQLRRIAYSTSVWVSASLDQVVHISDLRSADGYQR